MNHRFRHACLGALMLVACTAQAADEPRRIVSAPLQLDSADGLQRLSLPLDALRASRLANWGDVWLVDSRGDPLPQAWAAAPPAPPVPWRWAALKIFAWPQDLPVQADQGLKLEIDASGAVVRIDRPAAASTAASALSAWLLDLHGLDQPPRKLRLAWPPSPQGLRRQATVEASDDAQHWQTVGGATLVEAPAAGGTPSTAAFVQREIDIEAATTAGGAPRYLRLQLDRPLALGSVEAQLAAQALPAGLQTLTLPMRRAPGDDLPPHARQAPAAWLLDLGGPVPVENIQVRLAGENQVLPLRFSWKPVQPRTLPGRAPAEAGWQFAVAHTAYTLRKQGRTEVSPPFSVQASGARWWLAEAQGSVPDGPAPQLVLGWRAPQLVFAARGTPPFRLQIGGERPSANRLDLATLVPGYTAGVEHTLPQAATGPFSTRELAEPGMLESLGDTSPEQRKRWLLWAVLAVVVGALAWMARGLAAEVQARKGGNDPR